tara:strand:+ start:220 stop:375 length:156 start_codon:yes stop_codon:yes gene_type:complete
MMTEQDLDRQNFQQAKEKERLELNKYCSDKSIPDSCKSEKIIDYQLKWGKL